MIYVKKCIKRNGSIENFEKKKVQNAIRKSFLESGEANKFISKEVSQYVFERIDRTFYLEPPGVEEIQDLIEDTLMGLNFKKTAKLYILYRENRAQERGYSHYFETTSEPYF